MEETHFEFEVFTLILENDQKLQNHSQGYREIVIY